MVLAQGLLCFAVRQWLRPEVPRRLPQSAAEAGCGLERLRVDTPSHLGSPHSIVAGFQEQATQANRVKVVSPFVTASEVTEQPCAIATCHIQGERSKSRSPAPPRKECQHLLAIRACGMGEPVEILTIPSLPCTQPAPACSPVIGPHCLRHPPPRALTARSPSLGLLGHICVSWNTGITVLLLTLTWSTRGPCEAASQPKPPFLPPLTRLDGVRQGTYSSESPDRKQRAQHIVNA